MENENYNNYYPNTFQVPNIIIDTDISKDWNESDFRVFLFFARQLSGWRKQKDWCTVKYLSEKVNVSRSTISKAIKRLVNQGVLTAKDKEDNILDTPQKRQKIGRNRGKIYYTIDIYDNCSPDETDCSRKETEHCSRKESNKTNNVDKTNNRQTTYMQKELSDIKEVYEHWKSKCKDINNPRLTSKQKKTIHTKLKKWSVEDIKEAIDHYKEMFDNDYCYYEHNWTMYKFIKQSNGVPRFKGGLDQKNDGDLWKDYVNSEAKEKREQEQRKQDIRSSNTVN